jgi:hypothetical protein
MSMIKIVWDVIICGLSSTLFLASSCVVITKGLNSTLSNGNSTAQLVISFVLVWSVMYTISAKVYFQRGSFVRGSGWPFSFVPYFTAACKSFLEISLWDLLSPPWVLDSRGIWYVLNRDALTEMRIEIVLKINFCR